MNLRLYLLLAILAVGAPTVTLAATVCVPGKPCVAGNAATRPAPAPHSASVSDVGPEKRNWDVRMEDRTIQGTFVRWGAMAKPQRQVIWELPREFPIVASDSDNPFFGTFDEAVDRVLDSFATSDYPLKGCLYSNGVLRVVRRVDDGLECKR